MHVKAADKNIAVDGVGFHGSLFNGDRLRDAKNCGSPEAAVRRDGVQAALEQLSTASLRLRRDPSPLST
ncbi:hypothetical protein diail_739 [Diaporthe ilicicola]|nr:hypothetical protein diail_739 [Diaporthe ilicicola]